MTVLPPAEPLTRGAEKYARTRIIARGKHSVKNFGTGRTNLTHSESLASGRGVSPADWTKGRCPVDVDQGPSRPVVSCEHVKGVKLSLAGDRVFVSDAVAARACDEVTDDLKSPENACRLLGSIERLESSHGTEHDLNE